MNTNELIAQDVRDLINSQHHMITELVETLNTATQDVYTTLPGLPEFVETFPPFPYDTRITWYSAKMTLGELTQLMGDLKLDLTTIPDHYPILIKDTVYYTSDTTQEDALPF